MGTLRNAFGKLLRGLYTVGTITVEGTVKAVSRGLMVTYDGLKGIYDIYRTKSFSEIYKPIANILTFIYFPVLHAAGYLLSFAYDVYKDK